MLSQGYGKYVVFAPGLILKQGNIMLHLKHSDAMLLIALLWT